MRYLVILLLTSCAVGEPISKSSSDSVGVATESDTDGSSTDSDTQDSESSTEPGTGA